jgi:hypothetical protein
VSFRREKFLAILGFNADLRGAGDECIGDLSATEFVAGYFRFADDPDRIVALGCK